MWILPEGQTCDTDMTGGSADQRRKEGLMAYFVPSSRSVLIGDKRERLVQHGSGILVWYHGGVL